MTQDAYGKVYPFVGSNQAGNAEWRKLASAWGDGIINDTTGLAFNAVPSVTDRTIVVQIHELRMRGIDLEEIPVSGADPTTTITLTSPPTGDTRCDRIVARYDPSVPSINVMKVEGSPVSSGVAQPAALLRNAGGTWDFALWQFSGGNVVANQLVKLDERTWVGAWFLVPTKAALDDQHAGAAIGAHAYTMDTSHHWLRRLVAGTPTWVDEDDPGFTAFPVDTGLGGLAGGAQPLYGKANGRTKCRGIVVRTSGANLVTAGSTTLLGTLPVGFRPNSSRWFTLPSASGSGGIVSVNVGSDGKVTARGDATVLSLALDPIDFFAEQ